MWVWAKVKQNSCKKGFSLTRADLTPSTPIDGLLALRPLFIDCHPMYWWAEPLEMARRLALTSVTLMFQDSANVLLFSLFVNCLSIVWCVEREHTRRSKGYSGPYKHLLTQTTPTTPHHRWHQSHREAMPHIDWTANVLRYIDYWIR